MERPVERVRGFHDVDTASHRRWSATLGSLLAAFELAGFGQVDVPVLEQLDLYLRKNGAQVLAKLYSFVDAGRRDVALRPEFTASIIRALGAQVATASEPLRVSYAGPVFRYEKPQRATARQFTQAGVELLGHEGPGSDAEIVALACQAARDLGVEGLRLVLGHLAPIRALLAHLQVDSTAEGFLLEHLEYYNRGAEQQQAVRRRLGLTTEQEASLAESVALPEALAAAVQDASPAEARSLVGAILDQMGLDLSGSTRTPDEIIDRVLAKMRRQVALRSGALRENLERALSFIEWFGALRGEPAAVLQEVEALLRHYGVPLQALEELRQVLAALADYDLSGVMVELAPGMARGIAYYSGLIFELYGADVSGGAGSEAPSLQICGGGRYDGLARSLTGRQSFPALGFAFGVERLLHTIPLTASASGAAARVAVAFHDPEVRPTALQMTAALRGNGVCTVLHDGVASAQRTLDSLYKAGYTAAVYISNEHHDAPGAQVTAGTQVSVFRPAALPPHVHALLESLSGSAGSFGANGRYSTAGRSRA
jgi:histidyl-tRNA synthetase